MSEVPLYPAGMAGLSIKETLPPPRLEPIFLTYRGTPLIRNSPPPWGHHMALDIVLL